MGTRCDATEIVRSYLERHPERVTPDLARALTAKGKGKSADQASLVEGLIRMHAPDLAGYEREHRFHKDRGWRFDYAYVSARVAIEVDGGRWQAGGGRHATDGDREKLNAAAVAGWRVLRFSPEQLRKDPFGCLDTIRQALRGAPCQS